MVTVSVIIPTFNRAHTISRAVESVLCQTHRDLESIIVDDDSQDQTEEVVKGFEDSRVMYVKHSSNKGGSAARNTGIKLAKGRYIAFLDSDDEWISTKLEKQLKILDRSHASVGAVYTGVVGYDENERIVGVRLPKYQGHIFDKLLEHNCVGTASTVMVKREVFDAGGFDEKLPSCQDWDMWLRIAKSYEFKYIQEPLVRWYRTRNSISKNVEARVRGYSIFFHKFSEYFSTRRLRARNHLLIGELLCMRGNMISGRSHILQAVANDIKNPNYILHLFLSMFGHSFFSKLHEFLRYTNIPFIANVRRHKWGVLKRD